MPVNIFPIYLLKSSSVWSQTWNLCVWCQVIVWLVQLGMIGQQNEALFRNAYLDTEWFYELILPICTDRLKPLSL